MLSVIIGAFGAHSLQDLISDKMETFKTGVQYQMFHGLALILTGVLSKVFDLDASIAGYLFLIGIVLFSGSLYLLALANIKISMITPIGGMLLISAWILLLIQVSITKTQSKHIPTPSETN